MEENKKEKYTEDDVLRAVSKLDADCKNVLFTFGNLREIKDLMNDSEKLNEYCEYVSLMSIYYSSMDKIVKELALLIEQPEEKMFAEKKNPISDFYLNYKERKSKNWRKW